MTLQRTVPSPEQENRGREPRGVDKKWVLLLVERARMATGAAGRCSSRWGVCWRRLLRQRGVASPAAGESACADSCVNVASLLQLLGSLLAQTHTLRVRASSPSENVARDHRGFSPPHPRGNPEKADLLRVPSREWRTILGLCRSNRWQTPRPCSSCWRPRRLTRSLQ
jgi:hypothetical protein